MEQARFTMIDEKFNCIYCGEEVDKLGYTARDHCPHCLVSIHVDNNPGDRSSTCKGLLKPVAIEKSKRDKYKIVYRCDKCGSIKKNIAAEDDNFDKIIDLMSNPQSY